ncbi:MAG: ABC transporter substrate-binding protein, partial [Micromonosporaceae bacterium]
SANEQGADLRFVVAAANRSIWNVVAAPGTKSIKDLEGKSIGVSAIQSISTATTRQALAAHGVNVKKLKYIVAGGTSKRFAALEADRIAAAPLGIPVNYQASESSGLVDLGNTNDLGAPVLVAACVTVSDKWATSHEEELKRFLRGYQRAVNALYDPKMTDKIVQIAGKRLQIEPQYVKRAIQELFFDKETAGDLMPKDARIDRAGLVTAMEAFMEYGALKKKVDPSSVVDESYLDAAQKSLKEDPPK